VDHTLVIHGSAGVGPQPSECFSTVSGAAADTFNYLLRKPLTLADLYREID
jgi:hypothetical protein